DMDSKGKELAMILELGEKIHLVVRRKFKDDLRRHFIGEVLVADSSVARVAGYVFFFDYSTNEYKRRPEKRIRIIGLADSGNIINVLPATADIEKAEYTQSRENKLVVTDNMTFTLEINEFGLTG
nr:hypothetical protein [Desulfobulbaceae bacterium]